jgi:signal transduction histidine kinase
LDVRKIFFVTVALITGAFGILLMLALNQFQLYGQHEKIISQTEKFIFQYSIIREQIIEYVVTGNLDELEELSPSVEELHANIIGIMDNSLIPAEYKFSFLQQIDLPGLALLLRKATSEKANSNLLQIINKETRVIGERFILFERLVLGYAKQKLVDFQLVVIGILALVVFLVSILMLVMYRLLIKPVISLANQSENVLSGKQEKIVNPQGWMEVSLLSEKMNDLLENSKSSQDLVERYGRILNCCQGVLQKIDEHRERDRLCKSVCRALLTNQDYILAWIGVEDAEEKIIHPVAADGSSTMSCDECQECFAALLAEQEGDDPSQKAMQTGETVVMKNILADAPKGPFKKTPLADGKVDSISLPLCFEGETLGVLTIYIMVQGGEKTGKIVSVDSYLSASLYRDASAHWVGRNITDILVPENDSERIVLSSSLEESKRYDFNARLVGFDEKFSAILQPTNDFPAEKETFLLVLIPPQQNILIQPENFQIAYSAAIGQFANSIAHEITDVSNGIINYAQMLSDELVGETERGKKESLSKIIEGGEKLAAVVEPLLIDQNDIDFTKSIENIQKIFDDALMLVRPLYKRDGITINLDIQAITLKYKKQHLQLILLVLLNRLRDTLNEQYPHKDPDKLLDIMVDQLGEKTDKMLMISIQYTGREQDYEESKIQKGQITGMWLSQELARNMGGEIKFSITDTQKIKLDLLLPA